MVYNIVLAWKILGETVLKFDIIAMILMVSGTICAELFSQMTTSDLTYDDLAELFSDTQVILYIIIGYAINLILLLLSREIINRDLVNSVTHPFLGKVPLISLATFTGFQSGMTGVCLKSTVELIKT